MELRVRLNHAPNQEGVIVAFVGDRYGSAAIVLWGTRLREERLDELDVIPLEMIEEDRAHKRAKQILSSSSVLGGTR